MMCAPATGLRERLPKPPVRAVAVAAVADDGTPQDVGGVGIGTSR